MQTRDLQLLKLKGIPKCLFGQLFFVGGLGHQGQTTTLFRREWFFGLGTPGLHNTTWPNNHFGMPDSVGCPCRQVTGNFRGRLCATYRCQQKRRVPTEGAAAIPKTSRSNGGCRRASSKHFAEGVGDATPKPGLALLSDIFQFF